MRPLIIAVAMLAACDGNYDAPGCPEGYTEASVSWLEADDNTTHVTDADGHALCGEPTGPSWFPFAGDVEPTCPCCLYRFAGFTEDR